MVAPRDPQSPLPTDMKQLQQRLEKLITRYLESGKRSHLSLSPAQIGFVVNAALDHSSSKKDPSFEPTEDGFFMSGLYEELIQEPDSIFEKTCDPEGREQWTPLPRTLWEDCLKHFRDSLQEQLKSPRLPRRH